MKKLYSLSFMVFVFAASICAQPFSSQWIKVASGADYPWFTADNNVTTIDYNPVTDKLLVSKRNDRIFIVNAATGAEEGTLNTTGVGTESFKYNKIRITEDGVIYAISLITGAGQCKIYRWANQTAMPTLCADFPVTERTGDAFGLSGSGNNTILYASGSGTTSNAFNIYILNTIDGISFTTESKVSTISSPTPNQQWSNRVVEPAGTGVTSDIWINGGSFNARKISVGPNSGGVRTGTLVTTIDDGTGNGQASIGYGGMRILNAPNGSKYLGFGGGNNNNAGVKVKLLNITNEAAITTYGIDSLYSASSYVTNSNGTGDVTYKKNADGSYTVFQLSTNNGIQATKTATTILPVSLIAFTATPKNKSVVLNWVTATEAGNVGFHVEKSLNGSEFSTIGFVKTKADLGRSLQQLSYDFEDRHLAVKTYYRLKQVDQDGHFKFSSIVIVQANSSKKFHILNLHNPVRDKIQLSVNTDANSDLQIQVINTAGVTFINQQIRVSAGNSTIDLPANNLFQGLYYIIVKNKDTMQVIKIIK